MLMQHRRTALILALAAVFVAAAFFPDLAAAHGVAKRDAAFVQTINGPAIGPFLYLGAKHMVTGYDHLLFLVGVIFFLYRLKDILLYVSLFTVGHSLTLLGGALGGFHASSYLVDAVIAVGRVQGVREHGRLQGAGRTARHTRRRVRFRPRAWLRAGDETAGVF